MNDIKEHFAKRPGAFSGPRPLAPSDHVPTWLKVKAASGPVEELVKEATSSARLLQPSDVAGLLGVGVRTLERWRSTGEGPQYVKLSSKTIRYTDAAIAAFVADRLKTNTAS